MMKLYSAFGLLWNGKTAHCPKCKLLGHMTLKDSGGHGYRYICDNCDFEKVFPVKIENKADAAMRLKDKNNSDSDVEVIKLDDVLIKIQKEEIEDDNYWIDVKLSKNEKDEKQLMVLVGSRDGKSKTQLFCDIDNEKLSFDQNNDHPKKLLCKVVASFKKSEQEIR